MSDEKTWLELHGEPGEKPHVYPYDYIAVVGFDHTREGDPFFALFAGEFETTAADEYDAVERTYRLSAHFLDSMIKALRAEGLDWQMVESVMLSAKRLALNHCINEEREAGNKTNQKEKKQ